MLKGSLYGTHPATNTNVRTMIGLLIRRTKKLFEKKRDFYEVPQHHTAVFESFLRYPS